MITYEKLEQFNYAGLEKLTYGMMESGWVSVDIKASSSLTSKIAILRKLNASFIGDLSSKVSIPKKAKLLNTRIESSVKFNSKFLVIRIKRNIANFNSQFFSCINIKKRKKSNSIINSICKSEIKIAIRKLGKRVKYSVKIVYNKKLNFKANLKSTFKQINLDYANLEKMTYKEIEKSNFGKLQLYKHPKVSVKVKL